jgi:hypothetical protein
LIDQQARPIVTLEERREQQERPAHLDQIRCARCGGGLLRAHLVVGSYVEQRCHHTIKKPDGKRETCGYVTRVWPTR